MGQTLPVAHGALTDEERYRFDVQGYLVRRNVLSDGELRRLSLELDAMRLPPAMGTIQSQRFGGLLEAGGLLRDLMDDPAVLDVVRELCGSYVRLDHAYGIVMAPGTSGLGLHGGGTPFDPAQYYLVRDGRIRAGLVSVQWALVDHEPGDGGFCCIPGSHTASFGVPPGVGPHHEMVTEVALAAGDVVIFTEALTHGTLPWRAGHERRTLLYKYSPGVSTYNRDPPCTAATLAELTDQQRRLCQPPAVHPHDPV